MPDYAYGANAFKDLWAATLKYYSKKTIDMLGRSHPLYDMISGKGNFAGKEGGVGIRNVDLILARATQNTRWVDYRTEITTTEQNLLEQIEWDWKFCYQGFKMYDKVLAVNKSSQIANLLELNQRSLTQGYIRTMAKQIYSDGHISAEPGSEALEMGGLQYLLSENPYKSGLIVLGLKRGGIPGDNYEFWRNRAGEWVRSTTQGNFSPIWPTTTEDQAEALVKSMRHMIEVINTSSDQIDAIFTNYEFYNLYLSYMENKLRIMNVSQQKTDVGFAKVEYMGIPIYLDKNCPQGKMYFLNTNYLHFKYLEGENFRQEVRQVPHQFAKQYISTFIGNFIIEKPRCQGVLSLNSTTNGLPENCNVCNFSKFVDFDYSQAPVSQSSDTGFENKDYSGSGVYHDPTVTASNGATTKKNGNGDKK